MLVRPGWAIFTVLLKINANNFNFFDTIYIAVVVVFFALFFLSSLGSCVHWFAFWLFVEWLNASIRFCRFCTHLSSHTLALILRPPPPLFICSSCCVVSFFLALRTTTIWTHIKWAPNMFMQRWRCGDGLRVGWRKKGIWNVPWFGNEHVEKLEMNARLCVCVWVWLDRCVDGPLQVLDLGDMCILNSCMHQVSFAQNLTQKYVYKVVWRFFDGHAPSLTLYQLLVALCLCSMSMSMH